MQSKPVVQALYVTGSYAGGEGYNEDVPLPNPISPPPFPIFYNDTVSGDRPDDINRQVAFGLNYGISHRYFYASVGGSLQFGSYTPKARYFNPDPKQNYTALQLQMRCGATLPLGRVRLRPLGLVVGYADEWGAYQDYRNNRFGDTLTYVPRYNPERWFVGLTNELGVLIAPETELQVGLFLGGTSGSDAYGMDIGSLYSSLVTPVYNLSFSYNWNNVEANDAFTGEYSKASQGLVRITLGFNVFRTLRSLKARPKP